MTPNPAPWPSSATYSRAYENKTFLAIVSSILALYLQSAFKWQISHLWNPWRGNEAEDRNRCRTWTPTCFSAWLHVAVLYESIFQNTFALTWTCRSWMLRRTINEKWWSSILQNTIVHRSWTLLIWRPHYLIEARREIGPALMLLWYKQSQWGLWNGSPKWVICRWMLAYLMRFLCSVKSLHKL